MSVYYGVLYIRGHNAWGNFFSDPFIVVFIDMIFIVAPSMYCRCADVATKNRSCDGDDQNDILPADNLLHQRSLSFWTVVSCVEASVVLSNNTDLCCYDFL
mmetsp:Transcript_9713/g.15590  ORF Transcript_9713/g.15590 Transcript_9713/m.15590 type:complete len:101 (+) Transcript_9713:96-398(+)